MSAPLDWESLKQRFEQLAEELTQPIDQAYRIELQKEYSLLSNLLSKHEEIEQIKHALLELDDLAASDELRELAQEEKNILSQKLLGVESCLEDLLFPADPHDNQSVFLEIRAGAGGQEAALFAADLARMYTMYGIKKGWRVSVVDESYTDLGGFREVIMHIQGKGVYGHLKFESGVHRVQRVPTTETSGRVHTSTATVAVLPEIEEIESVDISPSDLRIDVYRAGGAGGQHVNKTDSAVRITHLPSGLVVACQEERSQHKNKAKAMKILKARLLSLQKEKQEQAQVQQRREQVGTGMRAEKVRTYNYPQNRITDHQVNLTLNKLDIIMNGDLDEIITALRHKDAEERRKKAALPFAKNK